MLAVAAAIVVVFIAHATSNDERSLSDDQAADLGDAQVAATNGGPAALDSPFPESGLSDWSAPREVDRYGPDELYLKIDGRAEAYLQFHVVGLTFGTYSHRTDRGRGIDVYWYDMGTPADAMGMYRSEAAPGATAVSLGGDGYEIGGAVFFWKGRNYIQVLPTSPDQADGRAALAIARQLDGVIADEGDDASATAGPSRVGRDK